MKKSAKKILFRVTINFHPYSLHTNWRGELIVENDSEYGSNGNGIVSVAEIKNAISSDYVKSGIDYCEIIITKIANTGIIDSKTLYDLREMPEIVNDFLKID